MLKFKYSSTINEEQYCIAQFQCIHANVLKQYFNFKQLAVSTSLLDNRSYILNSHCFNILNKLF